MKSLRIFLADDHAMLRHGLRLLINSQPDMEVIGEASDGRSAVRQALDLRPDVIVMDVSMPQQNGLQAAEKLMKSYPRAKILALSRHNESCYIQQFLVTGASGYVLKQNDVQELFRAIRVVGEGGIYIDPAIAEKVVGYFHRVSSGRSKNARALSEREEQALQLIAQGYSNKEVAAQLQLSVKTVETHKAHAMKKLDLHGRIDILRYAMLQGWLEET